jgi:LPXTG-motif cell wall-anchored protein
MPRARSVAIVLTAAVLAAPAAALGQGAGGAGDDQYKDPFTPSGSTTSGSQAGDSGGNGLSQDPNLGVGGSSGTAGSAASGASGSVVSGTTSVSTGSLPNTGSDPRLILLAGLSLLLAGAGLRLRTADEDF